MYRLSDSDSVDSDKGIRYKTDSIRNKDKSSDTDSLSSKRHSSCSQRERNRSRSPRYRDRKGKKVKRRTRERSSEDEHKAGSSSSRNRDKRHKRCNEDTRRHRRKEETKKEVYECDGTNRPDNCCVEKKEDGASYGPALPTRVIDGKNQGSERRKSKHKDDTVSFFCSDSEKKITVEQQVLGPALPPKNESKTVIGPALPPDFKQKPSDVSCGPVLPLSDKMDQPTQNLSEGSYGPTLPPPTKLENKTIGPEQLTDLIKNSEDDSNVSQSPPNDSAARTIGPLLPPHLRQKLLEESSDVLEKSPEESDDEGYGPVPEGAGYSKAHIELEERALKMKMAQLEPVEDKPSREEWMTILPEVKASKFGLGPRQFRSKPGPDLSDRSSWTDTPEDKAKKKAGKVEAKIDIRKEAELREIVKRDKEQEAIVKKTKKHKNSLLEIHQKKLEEKKGESGPSERRPFSREIDLKVNRFDEAQKKAVLKKAQLLDTRFSAGESKFL